MGKSPVPPLRLVHPPTGKESDPESRDTLVDAVDSELGMLLALPTRSFAMGCLILDTEEFQGCYVILTGRAAEYAISHAGEPDADRIELGPKDVIGLEETVRVEALTDLTVAVIDAASLASASAMLRDKTRTYIIEAARKRSTDVRRRLVERDAKILELMDAIDALQGMHDGMKHELDSKLRARERDLEEKIIDNTRIAKHVQRLTRELDHKSREVQSAANILELYKQAVEETEETLEERSRELSRLRMEQANLYALAPILERMMASGNADWVKQAQEALTILYTRGKKP
ncbi:hypothetical protein IT407_04470 [Candidatus Uhrbacteria bacterium]|nr:hypothetical protein [Candidatus Uhrbacteria bacterium]